MNLLLSNKLRLINPHFFFDFRVDQPCWYAFLDRADKKRQYHWRIGVKYLGETEEHTFSLASFKVEQESVWSKLCSQSFGEQLVDQFRSGGKPAVSDWLKEQAAET